MKVPCHCYQRCTLGLLEPVWVTVRTRGRHLALDEAEARRAQRLGLEPNHLLQESITRNYAAISETEDQSSEPGISGAPFSSPSAPDGQSAPSTPATPQHFNHADFAPASPAAHFFGSAAASPSFQAAWDDLSSTEDSQSTNSIGDSSTYDSEPEGIGLFDSDAEEEENGSDHADFDGESDSEAGSVGSRASSEGAHSSQGSTASSAALDPTVSSRHSQDLLDDLVGSYRPRAMPRRPPQPGLSAFSTAAHLGVSDKATLRHLVTSIRSKATERQYRDFAADKEQLLPGLKIRGKKAASSLLKHVTRLREQVWDMCPESCVAFTGSLAHADECPECGQARYNARGKPRKQYATLSILPRVRARHAAGAGYTYLEEEGERAAAWWGTDEQRYQDWPHGASYHFLKEQGFFSDPRHEAFIISVDGAQMQEKRKSNGWIVMLTSLNSPWHKRYQGGESFISTIIPGPNNPRRIDTFLYPILQEMARAAHGYWIWDAAAAEWFLWRAWIVAAGADQQGSAKLSQMTGPTGYAGCRNCEVVANYTYEGQRVGHFPLTTLAQNVERNTDRPQVYDPYHLPMRTDDTYGDALAERDACANDSERRHVRRRTGVGGRPLLSAMPAFTIPTFFPPDVLHLFGANLPSQLWAAFTSGRPGDPFTFSEDHKTDFGNIIDGCGPTLPSCIADSPPRNPFEHGGPRYKIYEWVLVVYVFLPSFLFAVGAPDAVVEMVCHLTMGVRLAMSRNGCSHDDLARLQQHFVAFAQLWEDLYIRGETENSHRATISVHHLLHISQFIHCHGSVRATSQARCEREIGLVKRSLRSHKATFASIRNTVRQAEHLRIYDFLFADQEAPFIPSRTLSTSITNRHRPLSDIEADRFETTLAWLQDEGMVARPHAGYQVYGKYTFDQAPGRSTTIRGSRIESDSARHSCHCLLDCVEGVMVAEVLQFVAFDSSDVHDPDDPHRIGPERIKSFAVCKLLHDVETLGAPFDDARRSPIMRGTRWSDTLSLFLTQVISSTIGIMEHGGHIYVLSAPSIPIP